MLFLALAPSTTLANMSTTSSVASSVIESEVSVKVNNVSPVYFDLILDEKISINDPRLKSIIYVSHTNPGSLVKIVYTNSNAKDLSEKLVHILGANGVKVSQPQLVTPAVGDIRAERFVTLWIIFPKYSSVQVRYSKASSELVMESK